ncbi:MAG: hypothetical protein Kow0058_07160 [Roseovarius sp.]
MLRAVRLAAWGASLAIAVLTLSPVAPTPPGAFDQADKLWHALAFLLWAVPVTGGWRWPLGRVLAVAAIFGGAIELLQPLGGRDRELADLGADLVGAGIGLWLGLKLRARLFAPRPPATAEGGGSGRLGQGLRPIGEWDSMGRMSGFLDRFLSRPGLRPAPGRLAPAGAPPYPPPRPEPRFVAIGDVHGRADLLLGIDRRLEAEYADWPVVFLGDYIDRGEQSREVLELLMSVAPGGNPPVICLMGNHERMLLDFLDDPENRARRWLRNGGLQTLASFGVAPPPGGGEDALAMRATRDRLAEAMGEDMIAWLRALPLCWQSGNVWAVHGGADPALPMESQTPENLTWGHPQFMRRPRADGAWVVHGHTVVDAPHMGAGRIAVDTGAFATGRLSAAAISPDGVEFLQAVGRRA